jgi:endogenous inhibitor of DNA gyrase (YacG/DUF329 family)
MPSGIKGSNRKYNCLHCRKENLWGHSKINKFCDNNCQGLFKWYNETIPRILEGKVSDGSRALKKYLIETRGEICEECGQSSIWNKKPLMLQLDHIDGDSDNNFPSNLRLLCPNCHTQTENFGSKGQGNRYKKDTKRNRYLQEYKAR